MTSAALSLRTTTARGRAASGTGVGIVLAVASVAGSASPAHAEDYTVQPGDTVSHIAQRTSTTVAQIVAANGLDPRARILVGQRLVLPTTPAPPAAAPVAATVQHTVATGDTVSALATRYGTTTTAIVAANGLDGRALIRIGQALAIPGTTAAPTAAPMATPAPTSATTHAVAAGDTVSAIARRYGSTTAAIVAANGLGANALIRIGQSLTIPTAPGAPTATPAPAPTTTTTTTTTVHTVASGDTVSGIARRYGTSPHAIVSANGLGAAALIRIGQRLSIPGASAGTVTSGLVGSTFAGRTYPAATVASANQNKATLLAVGVPTRAQMQTIVAETARAMGVDPALAQAIAYQESGFNHASVSPANAIGTMQVIPTTGDWASELVGRRLNLLDPQDNVVAGVAVLRALLSSAGDTPTAIAGYYQGLAGVRSHGMYADTRRYVASVQTLVSRFS